MLLVFAVLVRAMPSAPKFTVPSALRVIAFRLRTALPEERVTSLASALMVVDATASTKLPPDRVTGPPQSTSFEPSHFVVLLSNQEQQFLGSA